MLTTTPAAIMDTGYFFELPNSVRHISKNKLILYGWLMIGNGAVALTNACVATALEAVKTHLLIQYVNTHWITCVYLLTGASTMLVEKLRLNFFHYLAICMNLITMFVAAGALVFDSFNLDVISELSSSINAILAYNIMDIFTGLFALAIGLATLRLGDSARYMFLNYTTDEPVWNMIYLLTGLLTMHAARTASRVVAFCGLPLLIITIYPMVQYLWVDYRCAIVLQPHTLLYSNIAVTVFHLFVVFFVVAKLTKAISKLAFPWSNLRLDCDKKLRSSIVCFGLSLILSGALFSTIDIVNVHAGTFHHVFYPSEHKLPFYLIPAGAFAIASIRLERRSFYCIPVVTILLIFSFHATMFHVITYLYLTKNEYFGSQLCDLFFYGRHKCNYRVEHAGSILHFFEATLAIAVLLMSIYGSFLFGRLCSFYRIDASGSRVSMSAQEVRRIGNCHRVVRGAAWAQIMIGILVYCVSVGFRDNGPLHEHPLFVIHNTIHRTTLSFMLTIFPAAQLILSNVVHLSPMKALAIIGIACSRVIDILIQIDYRNLAYLGVGWAAMTAAEILTLFLQFTIMCACAVLFDFSINSYPQLELMDYIAAPTVAEQQNCKQQPVELLYSLQEKADVEENSAVNT
ncbi:hypothetical protein TTRE_0000390301 [Trichuris trichiura]|uniref:Uncharacterized protein n=1 Tax=Trichuris trichiura TaxID=36087 RepID=A0A077ZAC8_TRITR|nr:hypothetical protein TTRE_0000390301 [Trichuris trichiura]